MRDLDAAVRTVTHAATSFAELQDRARSLTGRIQASSRGYFTPSEEDEVRGLLVSYWQVRNALFELVTSFRTDRTIQADERPKVFLVAFAAALLLVDAARFMREIVADQRLIRRKLNEPALQFGVPAGVYDSIQKSLVSARHAWHLFYAVEYFRDNEVSLRGLAAEPGLDEILAVIDRLQHRLDVTVAQYARAKIRIRLSQIVRRLARDILGRAMYGLQTFGGTLMADRYVRPGHQPRLPDSVRDQILETAQPGDVFVVRKEYALTNYFLPGYWPHVALYLGHPEHPQTLSLKPTDHMAPRWSQLLEAEHPLEPRPGRVLESMKDGVHFRSIYSPFASDSIVVLRPRLAEDDILAGLARGVQHQGKPYDFDFDFRRADRLVCTEVVYRSFDGLGAIDLPLTTRAGRPTLSGGDLIRIALDRQMFEPVAVFAPGLAGKHVLRGTDADPILRQGERLIDQALERAGETEVETLSLESPSADD